MLFYKSRKESRVRKNFMRGLIGEVKLMNVNRRKSLIHGQFTLVELLITIAIIAILAAMLLPALSAAREKAQAIDCSSRLKSLMTVTLLYVDDNEGYAPYDPPGDRTWTYPLMDGNYFPERNLADIDKKSVFWCPSWAHGRRKGSNYVFDYDTYGAIIQTAGMSRHFTTFNLIADAADKSDIFENVSVSQRPFYSDSINTNTLRQSYRVSCLGGNNVAAHLRHAKQANIAFSDGHVSAKSANDLLEMKFKNWYVNGTQILL